MKNLTQLFKNIQDLNPAPKLEFLILQKIEIRAQKEARQKVVSSYIYMFGSVCLLVYSGLVFGQEILQSEFWSIASLLFSDLKIVLVNWQEFSYSLLETFPTISVVAILAPIGFLLWSLASYSNWHGKIVQHISIKKSFAQILRNYEIVQKYKIIEYIIYLHFQDI